MFLGKTVHSSSTIVTTVPSERSCVHAFFKCPTKRNRASHHLCTLFISVLDTLAWVIDGQIEKRRTCKQRVLCAFFFLTYCKTSHNSCNGSSISNGRRRSMCCSYCFITATHDAEFIAKPGTLGMGNTFVKALGRMIDDIFFLVLDSVKQNKL